MKLAISNIGWTKEHDSEVYKLMKNYCIEGIEIAPTRIIPENPYDKLDEALEWAEMIWNHYGFRIASIQSIWYGRQENIFNSEQDRIKLIEYTKKAVNFSEVMGCKNLVFGCPRNRTIQNDKDESIAIDFFREIGNYAALHNCVIAMEANPSIYNTNYINYTSEALELIKNVDSEGFKLNLDLGTMIYNKESIGDLECQYIHHVHISEPNLRMIEKREFHREIRDFLDIGRFDGYISIEMGKLDDLFLLESVLQYVKCIFG